MDKDALIAALHKADAAGDTEGARHLAQALRGMAETAAATPEPTPEAAPATEPAPAPHKNILDNVAEGAGNFVRGVTRLPGAAADMAGNFGRGASRIMRGDVSLGEAGDVDVRTADHHADPAARQPRTQRIEQCGHRRRPGRLDG